ncbi:MAG TPA: recombination regulator RecX [Burkholderiales bacterium]|jgi:regulatory protein|nr:recombination regulator RecX [Burkholderiales bacterium]
MAEPDTPAELKARALRHLVRREHSRAELARKLAPHAESPESLQRLLDELAVKKQLSDERYAEERARCLARKYGAARIRQDLATKGIDPQVIDAVSSGDELERARAILNRKYRNPAESRQELARRARFLQGRGFSIAVIGRLLRSSEEFP